MEIVKKYLVPTLIGVGLGMVAIAAVFRFGIGKKFLTGS